MVICIIIRASVSYCSSLYPCTRIPQIHCRYKGRTWYLFEPAFCSLPNEISSGFCTKKSVLLSPLKEDISWDSAFSLFPHKDWFQDPKSFVDGGGLQSSPDWSRPPADKENIFRSVRDFWIPKILKHGLHKFIVGHFQRQQVDPPFSEDLVQQFRASLDTLLPLGRPLDWQVRADQPLCLHALQAISHHMNDPDRNLFPALIEGVSTGFQDNIAPSNVFAAKSPTEEPARPDLSVHWKNWQTAESQPDLTEERVQEEIAKGWLVSLETLKMPNVNIPLALQWGNFQLPHRTPVHHD